MKGKNTAIMAGIVCSLIFAGCTKEPAVIQNEKAVSPGGGVMCNSKYGDISKGTAADFSKWEMEIGRDKNT